MYIKKISSYIPNTKIDNFKQAEIFGKDNVFITSKIGASSLPRKLPEQNSADLATIAVEDLISIAKLDLNKIDFLCVITQNPSKGGIPHTSAIVHSNLSLPLKCNTFDISLGCSGYIYGLSIASSFMEANGLSNGILVTSDPYSDIINPLDQNTSLLFGDSSTATLIQKNPDPNCYKIGKLYGYTNGKEGSSISKVNNLLSMNGRAVFNFALKTVPPQIKHCLEEEEIKEEDIDLYLMHQGSKAIVEAISRSFPANKDKFICNILNSGNTVSSSIPLILKSILSGKNLPKTILASGFGIGLSIGTMIIKKV